VNQIEISREFEPNSIDDHFYMN